MTGRGLFLFPLSQEDVVSVQYEGLDPAEASNLWTVETGRASHCEPVIQYMVTTQHTGRPYNMQDPAGSTWKLHWPLTPAAAAELNSVQTMVVWEDDAGTFNPVVLPLFERSLSSHVWGDDWSECVSVCWSVALALSGDGGGGDKSGCWEVFLGPHPLAPVHQN